MLPSQQNPQASQYPPQQYQQVPQQPPAPMPAPVPQGPQKDGVVAQEFKNYVQSVSWQVAEHQQTAGQHVIRLAPPAGRKLAKGDVKKAQISIKSMTPQPGAQPSGANSIQVTVDTEEKAGFFGSDRKSYPIWMNADEEVDGSLQPTTGLKDKIRIVMTLAKIVQPPPPPAPAQPPAAPQAQPGAAPLSAPPPIPEPTQQPPSPPPEPMHSYQQQPAAQQQYQQPAAQQQYQQPAAQQQYQQPAAQQQYQQPAAQQQYQQPSPQPQYTAQQPPPAYQPAQPAQPQWQQQQKACPNPNCRTSNAANATTCYRCGYQLQ